VKQKIIVFGNIPEKDAALLRAMGENWNLDILDVPRDFDFDLSTVGGPAGVVSYLPCSYEQLISIFGNQPLGFGENIPFYQRVNSNGKIQSYLYDFPLGGVFTSPLSEASAMNILLSVNRNRELLAKHDTLFGKLMSDREQKDRLVRVGMALCNENDYMSLMELILTVSREITVADTGYIYTRDRMVDDTLCDTLHYRFSQSDSIDTAPPAQTVVKIAPETLIGCAAYTGQFLSVDDVENIRPDVPFRNDRSFNCNGSYECKSVLTMPLKNIDDEVVAVLQLMNKKMNGGVKLNSADDVRKLTQPFTSGDIGIIRFLARYAALSLEKISLYTR